MSCSSKGNRSQTCLAPGRGVVGEPPCRVASQVGEFELRRAVERGTVWTGRWAPCPGHILVRCKPRVKPRPTESSAARSVPTRRKPPRRWRARAPKLRAPTVREGFSRDRYDLVTVRASDFDGPVGRTRVHQDDLRLDRLVAEATEVLFRLFVPCSWHAPRRSALLWARFSFAPARGRLSSYPSLC